MTSPQLYTAGYTGDIYLAIEAIKRELPNSPLMAVGVSMGASIITKYAAEASQTEAGTGLIAVASVSNPMDLNSIPKKDEVFSDPAVLWPYLMALSVRLNHYLVKHWSVLKQVGGFRVKPMLANSQ